MCADKLRDYELLTELKNRFFIPIIYSKNDAIILLKNRYGLKTDNKSIESYQKYLDESNQTTEEFDPVVENMFAWFMEYYKPSS